MKHRATRRQQLMSTLREARIKAGLTQEELCERIQRDRGFISTIELGTRKLVDVMDFVEIAEALGRRPTELLARILRPGKIKPVVVRAGRPRKTGK